MLRKSLNIKSSKLSENVELVKKSFLAYYIERHIKN